MSGFFNQPAGGGGGGLPSFVAPAQAVTNGSAMTLGTSTTISTASRLIITSFGTDDPSPGSFAVVGTDTNGAPQSENIIGFPSDVSTRIKGVVSTKLYKSITSITLHNTDLSNNQTAAFFTPYTT